MGLEPSTKTERNAEIIKDYKNGMNSIDLVVKYKITTQRIYQILKSHKKYVVEENRTTPEN